MVKSIYSVPNEELTKTTLEASMTSFASLVSPFVAMPPGIAFRGDASASQQRLDSASFTHALVALAAKLASVDGAPNKAEYAAFHALFVDGNSQDSAQVRSVFMKRVQDASPALQYARQIVSMTVGKASLHLDVIQRLLQVATADGALNAAELELLRAVAAIFGIDRAAFRELIGRTMAPASASPYEILGISARATDAELREHYMARVQKLHPDRYQAAGASAETITMLSDQLASVNAAYQAVQKLRAKKSPRAAGESGWWGRINTKGAKVSST